MANAIITEDFRRGQVERLIDDIKSLKTATNTGYFIGLGKSDPWNASDLAPTPTGGEQERKDAIDNLIALARVEDNAIHRLIVKTNQAWSAAVQFKRYDSNDPTCFNSDPVSGIKGCYAHHSNKLYLCLGNGSIDGTAINNTINNPTISSAIGVPGQNAGASQDKYIWVYICDLPTTGPFSDSQTFLTLPDGIDATSGSTAAAETAANKGSAGLIHGFKIKRATGASDGYTASQTNAAAELRITRLDGSNATLTGVLTVNTDATGNLTAINGASGATLTYAFLRTLGVGRSGENGENGANSVGIKEASFHVTGAGNGHVDVEVLLGPEIGYGVYKAGHNTANDYVAHTSSLPFDKTSGIFDVFPPFYLGLTYDFVENATSDVFTDIKFRQVSLVKNPLRTADTGDTSLTTLDSLPSITVSGTLPTISTGNTTSGWYMRNTSTGEQAWIDKLDSGNSKIYFHQNSSTGRTGGNITGSTRNKINTANGQNYQLYNDQHVSQGTFTVSGTTAAEHDENTGELIFLENRSPITRTSTQTEKARIILQF